MFHNRLMFYHRPLYKACQVSGLRVRQGTYLLEIEYFSRHLLHHGQYLYVIFAMQDIEDID